MIINIFTRTCVSLPIVDRCIAILAALLVFDVPKRDREQRKEKDCAYISKGKNEPLCIVIDFKYFLICNFFLNISFR